jgi:hypothetical protein
MLPPWVSDRLLKLNSELRSFEDLVFLGIYAIVCYPAIFALPGNLSWIFLLLGVVSWLMDNHPVNTSRPLVQRLLGRSMQPLLLLGCVAVYLFVFGVLPGITSEIFLGLLLVSGAALVFLRKTHCISRLLSLVVFSLVLLGTALMSSLVFQQLPEIWMWAFTFMPVALGAQRFVTGIGILSKPEETLMWLRAGLTEIARNRFIRFLWNILAATVIQIVANVIIRFFGW